MAPVSWIQRLSAACAAVVIGLALLSPPPSEAQPERAGDSPSHEMGAADSARVGVAPIATKRSAESTSVSLRVAAAPRAAASSMLGPRAVHAGNEAPALTRWRIGHGTSTASP